MLPSLVPYEQLIKLGLAFFGPILLLVVGFLYGVRQSNRSAQIQHLEESKKIADNISKAQKDNLETEKQRDEKLTAVRDAGTVDRLIKLFNSTGWGPKGGSGPSK